jgi:hypothetical protein
MIVLARILSTSAKGKTVTVGVTIGSSGRTNRQKIVPRGLPATDNQSPTCDAVRIEMLVHTKQRQ